MINCLIIDDQNAAIKVLSSHILSNEHLNLLQAFEDPIEAINYLEKQPVDLIFLDIEMSSMNGLEFMAATKSNSKIKQPKFILTTGYAEYALQGYEYGIIDYLMKPIKYTRFLKSLDRYYEIVSAKNSKLEISNLPFFFAEVNGKRLKINTSEIIYLESSGAYISIFRIDGRIVIHKPIGEVESLLQTGNFVRIHKSFIINIDSILSVSRTEVEIKFQNTTLILPVGRTYSIELKRRLNLD